MLALSYNAQAGVLSRQREAWPFRGAPRRKHDSDSVSQKDGQRRSPSAIPSPRKSRGILPRVDLEQAGTAAISPARVAESANGNAMGLPHLQPAALDALEKTRDRHRKLREAQEQTLGDQPQPSIKTRSLSP